MTSLTSPEQILQRVDLPIAGATGLPNDCYTTEASFVRDRDQVFAPNWSCIGFIDQLPEQNYALPVNFMGLPLLITRDKEDCVRVFHNVCSHRGMQLTIKACKNNGTVRCPYHNWTYTMDGALCGTPHVGGYGQHSHPDFDNAAHGLRQIRSEVWLGAIFINLDGNAKPFDMFVQPLKRQWSRFTGESQLARFTAGTDGSKMTLGVKSNWKLAVENYLEAYHLPSVHPALNRISPLEEHYCVEEFDNGAGQGSVNYQRLAIDGITLPTLDDWPEEQANQAEYPVLFPNTFFGIHADQLFILYLQPISSEETLEHVRIFYVDQDGALAAQYQAHREKNLGGWEEVFKEDIFAVERMQAGRHSPAFSGGVFSPEMDGPTHSFHKWVAHKLAQ